MTDDAGAPRKVGRFVLRGELGRGGAGVVYRAFDPDRQAEVALKVLLSGEHAGTEEVARFLRESRAASRLHHANIVRVHDVGWADGRPWLAMDLLEGPSLANRLEAGPVPPAQAARWLLALARALDAAHAEGIVHRDVKPGNVLFDAQDQPMLTDFGLAADVGADVRLTRTGQIVGTPAYVAPEATKRAAPDPSADVYSLGAVGWHLLTGRPPYDGDSAVEVLYALVEGPPEPLARACPTAPPQLARIVDAAMAREPRGRYASCAAMARDLEAFLEGRDISPPAVSLSARLQGARRRWGRGAAIAAGAVLVLAIGVGGARTWAELRASQEHEAREAAASATLAELPTTDRASHLREFVGEASIAGTRAGARALLELAGTEPTGDAAALWLARAFAEGGPAEQDEALRQLAAGFRANQQFASMQAALAQLDRRTPGASANPAIASMLVDAAWFRRDFAAAGAHLTVAGRPGAALAQRWVHATRGGSDHDRGFVVDTDGDGRPEWWRTSEGTRLVRSPLDDLTRTEVVTTFPERAWTWTLTGGTPPLLVTSLGAPPTEVTVRTAGGEVRYGWADSPHTSALQLGDGRLLVGIGAYGRHLVALDPAGDGFTRWAPLPDLDALRSDVVGLAVGDLEGDAGDELVVATGAWSAFDLRTYDADAPAAPLHRTKVGYLAELHVVPGEPHDTLWTLKSDEYASSWMFPPAAPYGTAPGATRWRFGPGGPTPEVVLPAPASRGPVLTQGLVLADLDGDGLLDPAFAAQGPGARWVTLVYPGGDPTQPPLSMGDVVPLFAAELDPAPGLELVVRSPADGPDSRWWILGVGNDSLPLLAGPPDPDAPPDTLTPRAAAGWRRAEELVAMGLVEGAARHLEQVAAAGGGPEALARASSLWATAGDVERSVQTRLAAARAGRQPAWYDEASRALRAQHRFTEAAGALVAAGREPDADLKETIDHLRELSVPLGDTWPGPARVLSPEHVVVDPRAGGRSLRAYSGDNALLDLPFTSAPGELGLSLAFDLVRAEWGSGLVASIPTPEGPLEVGVRVWGGGGQYRREAYCEVPGEETTTVEEPLVTPTTAARVALRVHVSTLEGTWSCRIERDGLVSTRTGPLHTVVHGGGDQRLSLTASDHAQTQGLLTQVVLQGLSVTATDAVALPPTAPPAAASDRVWEAAARGEPEALDATLARLTLDAELERELQLLLRTRPTLAGSALRSRWPDRYAAWFYGAWGPAFRAHPGDSELAAPWLSETTGVEERLHAPDAAAAAQVLVYRARAWLAAGQLGAADRDLHAASMVLDPATARSLGLEVEVANTCVELAALAAASGDGRSAKALALARTYVPSEIAEDLIARTTASSP